MTKDEIMAELKRLAAEIGKIELQRQRGEYVSMNTYFTKRREFAKLQKQLQRYDKKRGT